MAARTAVRAADSGDFELGGNALVGDTGGALWWPSQRMLVVSDLHLEKGSSFARFGTFLPPYDTAATLARLAAAIARYEPRVVVALGDNFHDGDGPQRLCGEDRQTLARLQRGRDWIWIAGNHDPDPSAGIGGVFSAALAVGSVTLRHEPQASAGEAEIAGHLHPMARISARGRALSRKCFVTNGERLVMPAFGAFTGGLNVRHSAFAVLFEALDFTAHMLGRSRLYAFAAAQCLPD